MRIEVTQSHIDNGIRLSTADPFSLAIKEELDKLPVPHPYLRIERVVNVSSSVLVTEHRVLKRKGREEIDLAFQKFFFGSKPEFNIHDQAFDWMVSYGNGWPVTPTSIEITEAKPLKG